MGGTYAGSPPAIAAAHAVLDIIDEEQLCARANQLGEQLSATLRDAGCQSLAEVRGYGSMIAAEFQDAAGRPSAEITKAIQLQALAQGLILLTCGVHSNVIRFLYPLTIPQPQFDKALQLLKDILREH